MNEYVHSNWELGSSYCLELSPFPSLNLSSLTRNKCLAAETLSHVNVLGIWSPGSTY